MSEHEVVITDYPCGCCFVRCLCGWTLDCSYVSPFSPDDAEGHAHEHEERAA